MILRTVDKESTYGLNAIGADIIPRMPPLSSQPAAGYFSMTRYLALLTRRALFLFYPSQSQFSSATHTYYCPVPVSGHMLLEPVELSITPGLYLSLTSPFVGIMQLIQAHRCEVPRFSAVVRHAAITRHYEGSRHRWQVHVP